MASEEVGVKTETATVEPDLPPLSASDFRRYNRMAMVMDSYVSSSIPKPGPGILRAQHNHFRHEWQTLWNACSASEDSKTMSAKSMINTGLSFLSHLTLHHDIEEAHIFPFLAQRMDFFKPDGVHPQQHREIHKGMEELEDYLKQCLRGSRDFRRDEVKECMSKWGDVLWTHLAEEVQTLGANNMRKYWSLDEVRQMPM